MRSARRAQRLRYDDAMAFTAADIDAFIEAIQQDPLLRDRVAKAILHEDFLALPGIVARLGERIEQLAVRMEALTERMDAQTLRMDELIRVTTNLAGRTGNLEGWRFEAEYRDRLASHLARRYRGVRPLVLGNMPALIKALDDGRIGEQEWDDVIRLDASAEGRPRGGGDEMVIVMELSRTVDINDVERVARRADIIRRAGVIVDAIVDGDQIEPLAHGRLADLGVISFVSRIAQSA